MSRSGVSPSKQQQPAGELPEWRSGSSRSGAFFRVVNTPGTRATRWTGRHAIMGAPGETANAPTVLHCRLAAAERRFNSARLHHAAQPGRHHCRRHHCALALGVAAAFTSVASADLGPTTSASTGHASRGNPARFTQSCKSMHARRAYRPINVRAQHGSLRLADS